MCSCAQYSTLAWWLLTAITVVRCNSASQPLFAASPSGRPARIFGDAANDDMPDRIESSSSLHSFDTPADDGAEGSPLYKLGGTESFRQDAAQEGGLEGEGSSEEAGPDFIHGSDRSEEDPSPYGNSIKREQGQGSDSKAGSPEGEQAHLVSALHALDPKILSFMADPDASEDFMFDRHALKDILTSQGFQFTYQSACTADRVGWVLDPSGPCCGFYCIGFLSLGIHFACPSDYCFQHPTLNSPMGVCNPCP